MTLERWKKIIGDIKDKFEAIKEGSDHLDDQGGVDIEFIEFNGPLGKMRLEFITKPVIMDKKTTYSNRIGSETKVDYVYSKTDKTSIMEAYKLVDGEWEEIEAGMFS